MKSLKENFFTLLIIFSTWQILSTILNNNLLLPSFFEIFLKLPELIHDDRFLSGVFRSYFFLVKVWILIFVILFILMLLSIISKYFSKIFKSLCLGLSPTPTFTWFPIFILVFGLNQTTIILLMIFATIWIIGHNLITELETKREKWEKHCKNLRLSLIRSVLIVYIPAMKESLISNVKITWNLSWRILISIEVVFGAIGGHWGIGNYMTDASHKMEILVVYSVLFIIIFLGILSNLFFDILIKRLKTIV